MMIQISNTTGLLPKLESCQDGAISAPCVAFGFKGKVRPVSTHRGSVNTLAFGTYAFGNSDFGGPTWIHNQTAPMKDTSQQRERST